MQHGDTYDVVFKGEVLTCSIVNVQKGSDMWNLASLVDYLPGCSSAYLFPYPVPKAYLAWFLYNVIDSTNVSE